MLTEESIIRIFCVIDDSLRAMNHQEDLRCRLSDSEVLTTAVVSGLYFGGHTEHGRQFMQLAGYIPDMLSKSRLCRLLQGDQWRGWQASMRRYFYGVKVQLVITSSGVPVDYVIVPGAPADVKALSQLCWALPPESRV